MNFKRKWLSLSASLAAVIVPTTAAVSCENKPIENPGSTQHQARNVYVVLDGLSKNGKDSFSDLATQAATAYYGVKPKVLIPKSSSPEDLKSEYAKVPAGSIIIGSGFPHIAAIDKYPDEIKNKDFVLVDGAVANEKVSSISFKIEEAAYIAGYSLAKYALTPEGFDKLRGNDGQVVISAFGGENKEQVTGFMGGFKNGFEAALAKERSDNPSNLKLPFVSFFTFKTKDEHFTGSFLAGEAKDLIKKFDDNSVDILLSVAGDQTKDVVDANLLAVGVDSPQEKTFGSKVLFSILKDIKSAVQKALTEIEKSPNTHHYISGTLIPENPSSSLIGVSNGLKEVKDIYDELIKDKDIVNEAVTQNPEFVV